MVYRGLLASTGVVWATLLLAPAPLSAQQAGQPETTARDVVVTARRADTARAEEKAAPNLENIQSAEAIAKYPDVNAAEALSRVPGVALSIDTAEGRFVNIRGLDGNFNGATFGGVVLLNTQPGGTYFNAAGRAVEFDTVPIGAIDRLVVTKTGLPDHDAEGLGGSVEMTPRTAIGVKHPFAEVTLGGGVETFRGHGLYRDEVVLGAPFGPTNADGQKPFSVVLTQFLYNDRRGFDDLEGGYADAQSTGVPDKVYSALELRRYNYNRKRFGYSGEFDFTPNAEQRLYARVSIAGYNESVDRNILALGGLDSVTGTQTGNTFTATAANVAKTLRDYNETHRNVVFQLGGVHHFGDTTFDWFGAYSRATYVKHKDYNTRFNGPDPLTIAYDNITDPNHPAFAVQSGASIYDPANYTLGRISNSTENDRDREWSGAANLSRPINLLADDSLKIGGKVRFRRKVERPLTFTYNYTGPTASLTNFIGGGPFTDFYGRYQYGVGIDAAKVRDFLASNPALFTSAAAGNASALFDDSEDVLAGYVQYQGNVGPLGILAGVRVENTRSTYRGTTQTTDVNGNVTFSPASTTKRYTNVFPTLQLRYQATPQLIARATYSTGIFRPGFFQTLQSASVDVGGLTISTGNPNLKPTYSNNFDLALDYSPSATTFLSLGLFDKELRNYITAFTSRGSDPRIPGASTIIISSYGNVAGSHARGVEASASTKFTGLPGLLGGFGVDANGSYVESAAAIRTGEPAITLPGTFNETGNLALFYERGKVKLRLAGQYESKVLFGVGGSRATDVFQDERITLDLGGSYDASRRLSFYVNAKNLTNEPLRFYEGSRNRPIQREYYDLTLEAGVKIHL